MAKKNTGKSVKTAKLTKLPFWVLWTIGLLGSIFLIAFVSLQVWMSTWKIYTNKDFGFSFRYPANWYITESLPITKNQVDKYSETLFYVDPSKDLANHPFRGVDRSMGNVQVWINKGKSPVYEARIQQGYKFVTQKLGSKIGYVDTNEGQTTSDLGSSYVFSREFFVNSDGYSFSANTETISKNSSVFSKFQATFYHLVGVSILNSFKFN